tara:strand:+ start:391 stop:1038 length:648 start_codon:yes stop_codon:yes gene_type:complete
MTTKLNTNSISEVYKARKNILNHIERQGYNISAYNDFSINEVNVMYQNDQLDMLLEKKDNDTGSVVKIYIKFYLFKILRHNNIQDIVDDLFNVEELLKKDTDSLIFVTKDDLNDRNTSELKFIWKKYSIFVNLIGIKFLQFDILAHSMVPNHRVLTKQETEVVMKRYNIDSLTKFPEISRFDPVSKVIGIKPGDVCEIRRASKSSIETVYYRVCI